MLPQITLDQFKAAVASKGLEDQFLKLTGLKSMDELSAENFSENFGKADSLAISVTKPSAAPVPHKEQSKTDADAEEIPDRVSASDFLFGFKHMQINYPSRKKASLFAPNSYMMFYIIHEMNVLLCEHFYFKREAPNYHPLLLRLYFGILFYIQTLRAQHAANALLGDQYDFLDKFLNAYPVDSLPIPAPLLHIFKSLCSSRPEIPQFGYVTPYVREKLGNATLKDGQKQDGLAFMLPNIPGILSMLATLVTVKGKKSDFRSYLGDGTNDRDFLGVKFKKDPATWTAEAYYLTYAGLEHEVEGTTQFSEDYVKMRHDNLEVPAPSADDPTSTVDEFLYLKSSLAWFRDLVELADACSKFFPGSGTLLDCSPTGPPVGQIVANIDNFMIAKPTAFLKGKSPYVEVSTRLSTTSRSVDQLSMIMAAASHINVRAKNFAGNLLSRSTGPFWTLGPIEYSSTDDSMLIGTRQTVKKMLKSKV